MRKSNLKKREERRKRINVSIKFSGNEIAVGKLILDNRKVHFKYDDEFLAHGFNLSPIRLEFDNSIQIANPDPFHGIFGVFDDSLPDGWGMLLLNRALEKEGLSLNDINILDQLAYIGETGRGALIYRPAIKNKENFSDKINIDRLKTVIDEVYKGTSAEVIEELMHLGGSSGGARPKANVGYNLKTDELMHGYNILPEDFEHWIIKFPSSEDPLDIANIEYAYYKMALAANIEMSECKLLESKKGLQIFGTKRFDRIGNNRVHMHSMAGLTHDNFRRSSIDYGHIIDTAYILEQSAAARKKVLRLAAFNIYSHNRDDHSKNFSWLMDDSGNWTLAPAYDLTYSSTAIDEHSTRVAGEGANPGRQNILTLAEEFSISKPSEIIEEVQDAISKWPNIAKECGVSKESLNRIQKKFEQIRD
ncbi:type II toxin-antitoxin system HipA family toxin [Leptobacterium sp. I13]|uniref:type II toxin-antitoxin system HipA family toxin n=1 Tax=Leptobacterium meishanense TaxID=3128904 RepID=UPI0030ED8AEE